MSVITHTSVTYPILSLCTSNKFIKPTTSLFFLQEAPKMCTEQKYYECNETMHCKINSLYFKFLNRGKTKKKVICSLNDTCTENNRGALFAGFGAVRLNIC